MTPQQDFLQTMVAAAKAANHIYPEFAACEAAYTTNFGASVPFVKANNIFGTRARASWRNPQMLPKGVGIIALPIGTQRIGQSTAAMMGDYARFTDATAAFKFRMDTLNSLPTTYYAALRAKTGEEYVMQVAAEWSKQPTEGAAPFVKARWYADPKAAPTILSIYTANASLFAPTPAVPVVVPAATKPEPVSAEDTDK